MKSGLDAMPLFLLDDLLIEIHPIFVSSALLNFKKYKAFLGIYSLLGKNLPNFVFSSMKLHKQYCHNENNLRPLQIMQIKFTARFP